MSRIADAVNTVIDAWTTNVGTSAEAAQVQLESIKIRQIEAAAAIEQKRQLMALANKAVVFLAVLAAIAILSRLLKK